MKLAAAENLNKVLIVEDEALVALEIEKNLGKNGFDVVSNIAYGEKVLARKLGIKMFMTDC